MGRRPFCWCVVWIVAGSFVPTDAGGDRAWCGVLLASLAGLLLVARARWARWPVAALAMCSAGCVLARGAELRTRVPDDLGLLVATLGSRPVAVRAVLEPDTRWQPDERLLRAGLRVEAVRVAGTWYPYTGRTWWSWYEPTRALEPGTAIVVRGRLRRSRGFVNPGLFDYGAYLRTRGYHSRLTARGGDAVWVVGQGSLPLRQTAVSGFRRHMARVVGRMRASEDGRGFLLAVLAGDRRWVGTAAREAGQVTGTYHLLSISGLHVGIVAAGVLGLARGCGLRRGAVTAVTLAFLGMYAMLTGGAVPVVRASLMFGLVLLLLRLRRPPDGVSILAVVAGLLLLVDPLAFRQAGTQLSFGAVAGLLVAYPPLSRALHARIQRHLPRRWQGPVYAVGGTMLVSGIVQVAVAPILVWHFHRMPLVGVLANTVATPLLAVVLATGATGAVALTMHPGLGAIPGAVAGGATEVLLGWIRLTARLAETAATPHAIPSVPLLPAVVVAVALACWVLRRRPVWSAGTASAAALLVALAPAGRGPGILEITALDVGRGDATVVRFPQGEVMVVDGGPRSRTFDAGAAIVMPYLLRQGLRRVDWLVATHGHNDHVGGLSSIVESLAVGEVWTNGSGYDTWTTRTFGETCARAGVPVRVVRRGEAMRVGADAFVHILNPGPLRPANADNRENNSSIIVRIDYGGVAVLLPGDASETLTGAIAAGGPWPERLLLKAPHHGRPRPGGAVAVAALRPLAAWASVGAVWPDRYPLAGLRGAETTWRTDWHGGLRIRVTPTGAITLQPTLGASTHWAAPLAETGISPVARDRPASPAGSTRPERGA